MKSIILITVVIMAVVHAAPAEEPIKIIRSNFQQQPEGGYDFSFETENGIVRQENGELKEVNDEENKPHKVVIVRGSYSYKYDDGKVENINYFADETGFHATGDSIPTNPTVTRR